MLLTKLVRMSLIAALVAVVVFGSSQVALAKVSNTVAVCGCGMVFIPDANTQYLTVGDKQYACCTKASTTWPPRIRPGQQPWPIRPLKLR
jgi:hypothetical protein